MMGVAGWRGVSVGDLGSGGGWRANESGWGAQNRVGRAGQGKGGRH